MKFEVPFIKPSLPHSSELADDYEAIIANNWFTNFGPFENRFKDATSEYLDNGTYATTVANATLGIDLAIRALIDTQQRNSKPRVMLMPSFTFAAGAEVIISSGMTPVFIDINNDSLQPNLEDVKSYTEANRDDIAGILLCNIFGVGNTQVEEWEAFAKQHELPLIIDSAAGFGSRYSNEERIGARGDCEVFSLHATKPFAIGEGGMVTSKDSGLIEKIRQLQNFGFGPDRQVATIGTNAKMQEINAAIGLRQLVGFEERVRKRQAVLDNYKNHLPGYAFQDNDKLATVAFASVLAPDASVARRAHEQLLKGGIEARRYYEPLHYHAVIARRALFASSLAVTEDVASRIISLPVHDDMDMQRVEKITDIITSI